MIRQQRYFLSNVLFKTQAIRTLRVVASICSFFVGVGCANRTFAVTNETGDASAAAHDQKSEPSIYGKIAFSKDPGPAKRLRLFSFRAQPDATRASVTIPYLNGQDGSKETSRFGSLECAVDGSWQETSYHHRSLEPGTYLIWVSSFDTLYGWESAKVTRDAPSQTDLSITFSEIGSVDVLLPAGWKDQFPLDVFEAKKFDQRCFLKVVPLEAEFPDRHRQKALPIRPLFPYNARVTLHLPLGKYRVVCGALEENVTITAEKAAEITLK